MPETLNYFSSTLIRGTTPRNLREDYYLNFIGYRFRSIVNSTFLKKTTLNREIIDAH